MGLLPLFFCSSFFFKDVVFFFIVEKGFKGISFFLFCFFKRNLPLKKQNKKRVKICNNNKKGYQKKRQKIELKKKNKIEFQKKYYFIRLFLKLYLVLFVHPSLTFPILKKRKEQHKNKKKRKEKKEKEILFF